MKVKILLVLIFLLGISITRSTAQTLQKGTVMGIHTYTLTLNPDVTMNQFLDFMMNKYVPASDENFPGSKMFILTGDRGENKNKLAIMIVFESVEVRDKYYPAPDEVSPEYDAAEAKMTAILEEMNKHIVDFTRVYTDWVIK